MIWTSTSGITISSSERPNIVRGSTFLIQPRRAARTGAAGASASSAPSSKAVAAASVGFEDISGAAHGVEIARITRVALDLAAQPHHLDIDVADIAAELR